MKRLLLVSALAAAALAPAPAHADHICVTSGDDPVVCAPHPQEWIASPDKICVKYGSRDLICVF